MSKNPSYLDLLAPWPAAVRQHIYRFPGNRDLACYGPGDHGHWALQSNTTAASAFAVLATDPGLNEAQAGMSRDEMLNLALGMIRFTAATHHAGTTGTTDGKRWGHSWISSLCLDRFWHAVEALGDLIPEADQALLQKVLLSEADWLLENYPVLAGPVENNKPESNVWNGCTLHRAARMVPDAPHAEAYLEKGTRFLLNGISIPEDASSGQQFEGKPLSEWHVGNNMFSSMGCNHHGYQNVGYMVITLSNIAMMHFHCKANGWEAPVGLYHHAEELWKVVKACTFDDGRLMRIGGDTRVRYCYCQDYAIPVWLWARDFLGDMDTLTYEQGWKKQVGKEIAANGDHSFLRRRLQTMKEVSPLYYLRLEGDRACTLGMGAYWNRKYGLDEMPVPEEAPETLQIWSDDYHGSCLARGEKRMASWTWRAAEAPQGLISEKDQSAMVEWRNNLAGQVYGVGRLNIPRCEWEQADSFDGGFATCGKITILTSDSIAEGDVPADIAEIEVACVALPDDQTMVVLQRARALNRPYLRSVKGLFLNIANDLYNDFSRLLHDSAGTRILSTSPGKEETMNISGNWLNVDDSLSVIRVYGENLCIHRPAERQVTLRPNGRIQVRDAGGSLYAEEICCGCRTGMHAHDADAVLFDLGVVIRTGITADQTREACEIAMPQPQELTHPDLRGVLLKDANGNDCQVTVNFSGKEIADGGKIYPARRVRFGIL